MELPGIIVTWLGHAGGASGVCIYEIAMFLNKPGHHATLEMHERGTNVVELEIGG